MDANSGVPDASAAEARGSARRRDRRRRWRRCSEPHMHGWRGAEGCDGRRRRLVRLMWPAARVEAEAPPPPAQGPPTSPSSSSVPQSRTTSYPPESAARKQDFVDSPRPVSSDSFIKVRFFVGYISLGNLLANLHGFNPAEDGNLIKSSSFLFFVSTLVPAI